MVGHDEMQMVEQQQEQLLVLLSIEMIEEAKSNQVLE